MEEVEGKQGRKDEERNGKDGGGRGEKIELVRLGLLVAI